MTHNLYELLKIEERRKQKTEAQERKKCAQWTPYKNRHSSRCNNEIPIQCLYYFSVRSSGGGGGFFVAWCRYLFFLHIHNSESVENRNRDEKKAHAETNNCIFFRRCTLYTAWMETFLSLASGAIVKHTLIVLQLPFLTWFHVHCCKGQLYLSTYQCVCRW